MKILHMNILLCILMILSVVSGREDSDENSFGDHSLRRRNVIDINTKTVMDPSRSTETIEQNQGGKIKEEGHERKLESLIGEAGTSERKLTSAHELFVTPIGQWNGEQWLFFIFLLFVLSYALRCLSRIRCCGCDLFDCLMCWCCYETFCDPDPGYGLC
mmetsp:Transcript_1965/g.2324  ORF Transcript_1965/g.2324 Transcript_1965/m.2324 type:complete len:159 (-) Transcript_1965:174-650(-)